MPVLLGKRYYEPYYETSDILDYLDNLMAIDREEKGLLFQAARDGKGDGYILEIGCDRGQSLCALGLGSKIADREKVFSIDIDRGRQDDYYHRDIRLTNGANRWKTVVENLEMCGLQNWVYLIGADSMEAYKFLDVSLRILYVDGNHDYPHTVSDIQNYSQFLIPGGSIFVHDYWDAEPETVRAVDECIRDSGNYREFHVTKMLAMAQKV